MIVMSGLSAARLVDIHQASVTWQLRPHDEWRPSLAKNRTVQAIPFTPSPLNQSTTPGGEITVDGRSYRTATVTC